MLSCETTAVPVTAITVLLPQGPTAAADSGCHTLPPLQRCTGDLWVLRGSRLQELGVAGARLGDGIRTRWASEEPLCLAGSTG